MRKNNILILTLACAAIALPSCSKLGKLTSENFKATPTPLEAIGGQVPVTINGTFPEKFMKKKAVLTVTPVLKYAGGQTVGQSATFQGEKVEGNDQTINYKTGGHYTMKSTFAYAPAMDKSDLYVQFKALLGRKTVTLPDVKIGYGVLATAELLQRTLDTADPAQAPDGYQRVRKQRQEADIKFLIEQANLRNSELKSTSVQQFVQTLKEINQDRERKELENVEVSAYASPDGSMQLNSRLAEQRETNSAKYVNQQLQANRIKAPVDSKYTAEDWDGFQTLVSASNIQDKDLILRVLAMYKDPEERERQIRNISTVYQDLANEVLPQLRRARLAVNYNLLGRSDAQIQSEFSRGGAQLGIDELLYGGNVLASQSIDKKAWYTRATELYPNDFRAYNNLARLAYEEGSWDTAEAYLERAKTLNSSAPEVNANLALLALKKGNADIAETYMAKASGANTFNEAMGCLNLARGNYAQSAFDMSHVNGNNAALTYILTKDYMAAQSALDKAPRPDATTAYLKAIVAARTKDAAGVKEHLREAVSLDTSLGAKAANDLEFSRYANDIQSIVK